MEEKEFYRNGNVSITNARFMVGSTTYAMNGVTSVKRGEKAPSKMGPIVTGIIGVVMVFAAATLMYKAIGVLLVLFAVFWFKGLKTEYLVFLNSASGESQALTSTDKSYIDSVIHHLNEAIIHRG
ncbi:DUF6232 family protein [Klebsiella michiganensis]|uniref:DUF6232 family protein n=1 Tax=Klebsiella TaxID=570 RepID=UPI000FEB9270|nr:MULTISPECIES: DUF6232 family protein [Klebsiella]MCD6622850.1 DUF6232 family protein [Klebsiella michiganensis]MDH0489746.1 DUF6232 family protein [Klebsiella michiganensis]RWS81048.1 QacE [Klebsiella michiganensis]